jgi:hypothetical protein
MAMAGSNDKLPYGSMLKILKRYRHSAYQLTWSQVFKWLERLKKQEQGVFTKQWPSKVYNYWFWSVIHHRPPGTVTETVTEQEEAGQRAQQKRRKNKLQKIWLGPDKKLGRV